MASNILRIPEHTILIGQELNGTELKFISSRLEQWFTDIEKNRALNTAETNSYLTTQFLSHFGLKNSSEVFDFLKSAGGRATLTMIARELIEEEAQIQSKREQNAEELLKKQRLLYLLMGLIADREAMAKNVDRLVRLEMEKLLTKEKYAETSQETTFVRSPIEIIDAMIYYYLETIQALDEKLEQLEYQLEEIEAELATIEVEEQRMNAYHEELHAHIDILDTYLKLPILNQPKESPSTVAERRITVLMKDLEAFKEQERIYKNTNSEESRPQEIEERRISRHIKVLEHELNFHQVHLSQTVTNYEELFRLALEQTRAQIQELQSRQTYFGQFDTEIEGLQLRERGLASALKVMRNKKILLNDQLEQVFDFTQARFIIKPEDEKRLIQKSDGSYALIAQDVDPANLTEEDWLQAKLNFDQTKARIQTPRFNFMDKIQENLHNQIQRKEKHLKLRDVLVNQRLEMRQARETMGQCLNDAQAQKTRILGTHTPTPKPNPQGSYLQMVENFEFLTIKAPKKEDIEKVQNVIKNSSISSEVKGELNKLIEEVTPEKIMEPDRRLKWLYSAKRLIKDVAPTPEVDVTMRKKE
ncbi:hypothetical protein [Legionella sp. WA2022007384]